jgi:hypothetical protein
MTLVTIDDRAVTIGIEGAGGEVSHYRPELISGGLALCHQTSGARYELQPASGRLWRCDCPAWHWRRSKDRERGCKHVAALMHLMKFLTDFRPLLEPHEEKRFMSELTGSNPELSTVMLRLAEPFVAGEVKFKPAMVSGARALALAYVDARTIQDRLDAVLGVVGWQDEYECLPDGAVVCKLRLRLGEEWITKMDVGSPSEQPDEGDRRKAAFSDALKRAAVKFGVGRYLYRLPSQWVDWDVNKRQFRQMPRLVQPQAAPVRPVPSHPVAQAKPHAAPPADGSQLEQRLAVADQKATAEGFAAAGELTGHVVDYASREGGIRDLPMAHWPAPMVAAAWQELLRRWNELRGAARTA